MTAIKNKKRILMVVVVFLFFVAIIFVSTRATLAEKGFGSINGYLDDIAVNVNLKRAVSVPALIGQILFGVLGFLGVVCLLLVIYAGLKWMLADGNEETVSESKKIILYAIIGMLVIMGSYAVTYYVVDKVLESTLKAGPGEINVNNFTPGPVIDPAPVPVDFSGCDGNSDCAPYCPSDSAAQCLGGSCFCSIIPNNTNTPGIIGPACSDYRDCSCGDESRAYCNSGFCECIKECDHVQCYNSCVAANLVGGMCEFGSCSCH